MDELLRVVQIPDQVGKGTREFPFVLDHSLDAQAVGLQEFAPLLAGGVTLNRLAVIMRESS